jgi:hypothetical protein
MGQDHQSLTSSSLIERSAKLVGHLEDLEGRAHLEPRPESPTRRLEFMRDASDVLGGVPDADDLDRARLPVDQHIVLTKALGSQMDGADVFNVGIEDGIDPLDGYLDP